MFGKFKMGNLLPVDFWASSHNNRGEAATTIPHFSFLISHSGRAFIRVQGTARPMG